MVLIKNTTCSTKTSPHRVTDAKNIKSYGFWKGDEKNLYEKTKMDGSLSRSK